MDPRILETMFKPKGDIQLPNGFHLYWEPNEVGGRRYTSDEVGGGVQVWDTSLVDANTMLAAIVHEARMATEERVRDEFSLREAELREPARRERRLKPWSDYEI